jgi:hypothetical protein
MHLNHKGGKPIKLVRRFCNTCKKETDVLNHTCMECLFDVRTILRGKYDNYKN